MSRNSDRANTVLFRYQEQRAEAAGHIDYNSTARPRSVQRVSTLKDAENWRKQVLKEISQKVNKIHDEKLSNYQIRDLNDDINKLMREKYAWEKRIQELGGPDYLKSAQAKFAEGGVLIRGYRYFGRAKELPGVKQILAKQQDDVKQKRNFRETEKSQRQKVKELESRVNLEYYGFFDEDKRENTMRNDIYENINELIGDKIQYLENPNKRQNVGYGEKIQDKLLKFERSASRKKAKKLLGSIESPTNVIIIEDNEVPSQKDVEAYLVERRRRQLEEKYNI